MVDASKTVMDVLGVVVANDERRTGCKSWNAAHSVVVVGKYYVL